MGYHLIRIRSLGAECNVMTVKPEGQVDQELHLQCSSTSRRPPGHRDHRRDDSIADNVESTRSQSGGPAEAR